MGGSALFKLGVEPAKKAQREQLWHALGGRPDPRYMGKGGGGVGGRSAMTLVDKDEVEKAHWASYLRDAEIGLYKMSATTKRLHTHHIELDRARVTPTQARAHMHMQARASTTSSSRSASAAAGRRTCRPRPPRTGPTSPRPSTSTRRPCRPS